MGFSRWLLPVVVLASVAMTSPARAAAEDPGDPKAVARAKLVEGGELLRQGEYTAALSRFQEAYDLVHSPKIQYNFGLAYMGLGRKADAIEAFETFLNEALDASPDLRANAERHRSTLATQTGALVVTCDTDGAEVSVDGRSHGVTPLQTSIRLDPGPHQLVVEKQGRPPYAEKVTIEGGKRVAVEAKLVPAIAAAPVPPPVAPGVALAPPPPQGPPPPTEAELAAHRRSVLRKVAWTTGAVGVAALGFGLAERLLANGKFNDFNSRPQGCDADDRVLAHGGGDCSSLLSAGRSSATLSTVGFISGAVLAGASAVLFYTSRAPADAPVVGLACGPDVGRHGLLCQTHF